MSLRLLAVGDLHLGRRPSRLPSALVTESRMLAPAGAWQRLVDRAIGQNVHVVALAGDVVEREDDFYEAYRELAAGVERMTAAGIRVVGIAGNHDVHVLPRLAERLDNFELIGRGGQWQRVRLDAAGENLTLHGWSFPQAQVLHSPLAGQHFERRDGVNLGLLHCDRDQRHSHYAPVTRRELQAAQLDGWLLGHIHVPDQLTVAAPDGYLGSVSGMDPGEADDHGPWLYTIDRGRIQAIEQWVLAPLRWEVLALDLSDLAEPAAARVLLMDAVRQRDQIIAQKTMPPVAVGLRLRLVGRTRWGREVDALLAQDAQDIIYDGQGGTRYFIERQLLDTRPVIALETLARRSDPPGLLARRLLLLAQPQQQDARQLIADGRQRLQQQHDDARWQGLQAEPLDDAMVAAWLQRAGMRLLEDMLNQQGGAQS